MLPRLQQKLLGLLHVKVGHGLALEVGLERGLGRGGWGQGVLVLVTGDPPPVQSGIPGVFLDPVDFRTVGR